MLGTGAPSPALSAHRENFVNPSRVHVGCGAGEGARAPSEDRPPLAEFGVRCTVDQLTNAFTGSIKGLREV
jgi:hypothetical protein